VNSAVEAAVFSFPSSAIPSSNRGPPSELMFLDSAFHNVRQSRQSGRDRCAVTLLIALPAVAVGSGQITNDGQH
jgi:hypothetical protein